MSESLVLINFLLISIWRKKFEDVVLQDPAKVFKSMHFQVSLRPWKQP